MSASAEYRHWSGRAVRWSSCARRPTAARARWRVAAFVKRDADFKPLLTHWVSSRIVPRTEAVHRLPVACGM